MRQTNFKSCSTRSYSCVPLSTIPLLALLCLALVGATGVHADTSQPPSLVAQGFDISQPRKGVLGKFPRVRIRVEAPEGIEELHIKERSFEADLAATLELSNLQLFGLAKRARRHRDLTLNFQNYLNSKIETEGAYTIEIMVMDNKEQVATAKLLVVASSTEPADTIETGTFRLIRIGAGPIQGSPDLGISWKTVESSQVVISIGGKEGGATALGKITESDYEKVKTKKMLEDRVQHAKTDQTIELATVNNAASGEAMAVVYQDQKYLLRVIESKIEHSDAGTHVILQGEYKH